MPFVLRQTEPGLIEFVYSGDEAIDPVRNKGVNMIGYHRHLHPEWLYYRYEPTRFVVKPMPSVNMQMKLEIAGMQHAKSIGVDSHGPHLNHCVYEAFFRVCVVEISNLYGKGETLTWKGDEVPDNVFEEMPRDVLREIGAYCHKASLGLLDYRPPKYNEIGKVEDKGEVEEDEKDEEEESPELIGEESESVPKS